MPEPKWVQKMRASGREGSKKVGQRMSTSALEAKGGPLPRFIHERIRPAIGMKPSDEYLANKASAGKIKAGEQLTPEELERGRGYIKDSAMAVAGSTGALSTAKLGEKASAGFMGKMSQQSGLEKKITMLKRLADGALASGDKVSLNKILGQIGSLETVLENIAQ